MPAAMSLAYVAFLWLLLLVGGGEAKLGSYPVLQKGHGYTVRRVTGDELTMEEFARWWRETGAYELHQLLLWRWDRANGALGAPLAPGDEPALDGGTHATS